MFQKISIIQQSGNMQEIFSIKNKVVVITGATGYLGVKMVEQLTLAGALVMILSTSISKSRKLCTKLNIPENRAYEIDISCRKSIKSVFKSIYDTFQRIDVLVNNAHFGVTKYFHEYTKQDWHKSLDGTVVAIDMTSQEVVPYMTKNNSGRIINISSMYGMLSPNPDVYPSEAMINPLSYGVGKAAIIQYTKYSAMMLAKDNITVNTISYGPFPNINNVKNVSFLENLANKTFLKRIGKPEEVTSAIFFLSLDESSYVTAQNIVIDGGWTSW